MNVEDAYGIEIDDDAIDGFVKVKDLITYACCVVKVTPRDGETEADALRRANQMLDKVHPQRQVGAA